MQTLLQAMKQYNKTVQSFQRGEAFFNSKDVDIKEKEKRAGDFQKLIVLMGKQKKNIESMGYTMTQEETFEGFRQIEYLNL